MKRKIAALITIVISICMLIGCNIAKKINNDIKSDPKPEKFLQDIRNLQKEPKHY